MSSNDLTFTGATKTVTTAGVREILGTSVTPVRSILITALSTNTGVVYVGGQDVSSTVYGKALRANEALDISVPQDAWAKGEAINLSKIWLDVDVSGEGVSYLTEHV